MKTYLSDVLMFLGFINLALGVTFIYWPLGFVVAGCELLFVAYAVERAVKK